ncbi:MAG: hypothetical protein RIR76_2648 [Verrucomicrobiota bacterium]|jgi:hypothetical protein
MAHLGDKKLQNGLSVGLRQQGDLRPLRSFA